MYSCKHAVNIYTLSCLLVVKLMLWLLIIISLQPPSTDRQTFAEDQTIDYIVPGRAEMKHPQPTTTTATIGYPKQIFAEYCRASGIILRSIAPCVCRGPSLFAFL